MQIHVDPRAAGRLSQAGGVVLRYGLVVIFVAFGLLKFTRGEAAAIQPLGEHSPILFWLYRIAPSQAASNVIGVIELGLAGLIAARRFSPWLSGLGSLGTAFALLTTLSFLVTTPNLGPDFQGFILKDLVLLGAALWTGGEAFGAAQRSVVRAAA
ncbi:MAG TPA: DUF417 family protein [Caulobacteraceae bacterium]|nr:DUF417 family protein [Caulobacteraceae bacterium]